MATRNLTLVGQIAIDLQLVTKEQLQECIDFQAGQVRAKPIGALLVEYGFLTEAQLAAVIAEQQRRLQESLPHTPTSVGAASFGRRLIEAGLVKPEQVNEALRAQQDLAERGIRRRLGELLVEAGHLKAELIPGLLKKQGKTLMACTFCGSHYNVISSIAEGYPCRQCGMPMNETLGTISAIDTAYLLPAMDSRPRPETPARPVPVPVATPPPAPPPPAMNRDLMVRLFQVLLIIIILSIILYFLSQKN
jgi:uncharacterized protein (DUF433 family)